MTDGADRSYPGELAAPGQVLRLADEFRSGAALLLAACRRGDPLSQSPFRLSAVHAIELYLNAVLLSRGHAPATVRGMQHDLGRRAELVSGMGLALRARTSAHLAELQSGREYLVSRYCADRVTPPPLNRLAATLEEVARKSRACVELAAARPAEPTSGGPGVRLRTPCAR